MTLDQLEQSNFWIAEQRMRLANRMGLMLQIAKKNGGYVGYGATYWHTLPQGNALTHNDFFLSDHTMRFDQIPGYNSTNQTITLNGRTYNGSIGHFTKHQTFNVDYRYFSDLEFTGDPATFQNIPDYPALWADVSSVHAVAAETARTMINYDRMIKVNGQKIANVRQLQPYGEQNFWQPFAWSNSQEKVDVPPYLMRIAKTVAEFMDGDIPGSGYFNFDNFVTDLQNFPRGVISSDHMLNHQRFNKHWHTYEAITAAARDLQDYHEFLFNSTLTTDLDFKYGGTGSWVTSNPLMSYGNQAGGGQTTRYPTAITRHIQSPTGLYVMVLAGHEQGWETTRTDHIRIPNVMSTNTISITYKGRDVALFQVFIPNGTTNTTYTAKSIVPAWERKGYGGIIV